jgi:hypothetical protein
MYNIPYNIAMHQTTPLENIPDQALIENISVGRQKLLEAHLEAQDLGNPYQVAQVPFRYAIHPRVQAELTSLARRVGRS